MLRIDGGYLSSNGRTWALRPQPEIWRLMELGQQLAASSAARTTEARCGIREPPSQKAGGFCAYLMAAGILAMAALGLVSADLEANVA